MGCRNLPDLHWQIMDRVGGGIASTVRTVPYTAVHDKPRSRCAVSSNETRPRRSKKTFGNAAFLCETPPYVSKQRLSRCDAPCLTQQKKKGPKAPFPGLTATSVKLPLQTAGGRRSASQMKRPTRPKKTAILSPVIPLTKAKPVAKVPKR